MESKRLLLTDKMKDWILLNYAYLSGGKTSSGSYIITFPEVSTSQTSPHAAADENMYALLFRYLCSTVQNETLDVKFSLIIDRRLNRWANVKSLFTSLQECTSEYNTVERIYLLQPSGLFNSLSKLFLFNVDESKDFKQQTLFVTLEELHKHIDQSQLTTELGGTLTVNLDEWISDRKMIESLIEYTFNIEKNFEAAIDNNMNNQIKSSSSTSLSSSNFSMETSLEDIIVRSQSRVNALQSLVDKCGGCISNAVASLAYLNHEPDPLKLSHILVMESLKTSTKALMLNIENELGQQKTYLNKLLKIQTCSERLNTVKSQVEKCNAESNEVLNDEDDELINMRNSSYLLENPHILKKIHMLLTRMRHIDGEIKALLPVFDSISLDIHKFSHQKEVHNIEQSTALNNLTAILLNDRKLLEETLHQTKMKVKDKIQQLIHNQHYLSSLNKAGEVVSSGAELMKYNSFLLDEDKSIEEISLAIDALVNFIDTPLAEANKMIEDFIQLHHSDEQDDFQLKSIEEKRNVLSEMRMSIDGLVEGLTSRRNEMIERRRKQEEEEERRRQQELQEDMDRLSKDVIDDNIKSDEDSTSIGSTCSEDEMKTFKNKTNHRDFQSPINKTRKAKIVVDSKIIPSMVLNSKNMQHQQRFSIVQSQSLPFSKQLSDEFDSQSHQPYLIDIKRSSDYDMEKYVPTRLKDELMSIQPAVDSGTIRRKRSHVIQELIETERAYVSDLRTIIKGYYDQFENSEMVPMIPGELLEKKDVLFGNIKEIYSFHNEIFLESLEICGSKPGNVGRCFIENKERFQLYSHYCQNKLQAEILIEKFGDNNPFFMTCQKKLKHSLPLSSYILKPVQRITKYHLLLKELLRMTTMDDELFDLRKAIVAIGDVLRYVNNSMHQLSIIGYNGNLSSLGRLLMQGSLDVTVDKRKDRSPSLKQTFHKRQVFLYDTCFLFCKKKDIPTSNLASYIFKSALKTDEVGPLVEFPRGGDERKFELWSKSEVWSFLAPTLAAKEDWVEEIKKVLFEQMDMIRASSKRIHVNSSSNGGVVVVDALQGSQSDELDSLTTLQNEIQHDL